MASKLYLLVLLAYWFTLAFLEVDSRLIKTKGQQGSPDVSEEEQDDDDESGRVSLGNFESYAHQLAGEVILLNENTMEITGLNYDGTGPAAWFMLGKTVASSLPEFIELEGTIIPDENENCETLRRYSGDDVKLKLPGKMKFKDFDYISMYCIRFNHNFGYVMIPDDIKLKNGTIAKNLKECDQDDVEDAEDNRPSRPRPRPGPPPPSGGGGGLLGGLLNNILG